MNFKFEIKDVYSGTKATLYTYHVLKNDKHAFELFIDKYQNRGIKEFDELMTRLMTMAETSGCNEIFFKPEHDDIPELQRIITDVKESELRLYCLRFSSQLLIIGSGEIKPINKVKRWQDSHILKKCVDELIYIHHKIQYRINTSQIIINGSQIQGNLLFKD